jgi:CTP:molybdopterin cytidylyltransferase MocA
VSQPVAAVVLAAGAASRFGAPKQALLLPLVLARLEPLLRDGSLSEIVVVTGAHPLPEGRQSGVRTVVCPDWALGPGASLRAGLAPLADDVAAAVVVLSDGPSLAEAAVRRVVEAWRHRPDEVVAAAYGGVRGHPLVIGRRAWSTVPDEGLRTVRPALVACDDLGDPGDIDTPSDLETYRRDAR